MSEKELVALFSFLGAIIAAFMTGVVNTIVQYKQNIKKSELDLYFVERNKAYQTFASSLDIVMDCFYNNHENYIKFMNIYFRAYLLASDETKLAMEELYEYLSENRHIMSNKIYSFKQISPYYKKICECMRCELTKPTFVFKINRALQRFRKAINKQK